MAAAHVRAPWKQRICTEQTNTLRFQAQLIFSLRYDDSGTRSHAFRPVLAPRTCLTTRLVKTFVQSTCFCRL